MLYRKIKLFVLKQRPKKKKRCSQNWQRKGIDKWRKKNRGFILKIVRKLLINCSEFSIFDVKTSLDWIRTIHYAYIIESIFFISVDILGTLLIERDVCAASTHKHTHTHNGNKTVRIVSIFNILNNCASRFLIKNKKNIQNQIIAL